MEHDVRIEELQPRRRDHERSESCREILLALIPRPLAKDSSHAGLGSLRLAKGPSIKLLEERLGWSRPDRCIAVGTDQLVGFDAKHSAGRTEARKARYDYSFAEKRSDRSEVHIGDDYPAHGLTGVED